MAVACYARSLQNLIPSQVSKTAEKLKSSTVDHGKQKNIIYAAECVTHKKFYIEQSKHRDSTNDWRGD